VQDSIDPRLSRSRRAWLVAVSLVSAVLVTGCGGGSSSKSSATAGRATTTGAGTTSSRSAATADGPPGALAFAKCMRSSGVPDFPDPQPGGGFAFHASPGVVSSPAFKAAQAKCQKYIPGGGPLSPGAPPSAQTMAQLRQIAVCMRQHGVPQFPDPRTSVPPGFNLFPEYRGATNYKGAILLFPATIDMQSPAYEQAAAACGAGFLGGQHPH
jgi:hypothetical protein